MSRDGLLRCGKVLLVASAPYTLDTLDKPTLGLVVLQADETIEQDFRRLFLSEACNLYVTRIPSATVLTPESIGEMENTLPAAVSLFPGAAVFDAVAYACTSGTAHIGQDRVREIIQETCAAREVTNPLGAAIAALSAVGAKRIGIVSPYSETVVPPLLLAFQNAGFDVAEAVSFGEEVEANVVRVSASSLLDAIEHLVRAHAPDAVFLSCTNLRTLAVIPEAEARFGLPVISSNLALAWHMTQLAKLPVPGVRMQLMTVPDKR